MANIMGENIQLFMGGKTLACATSCSVDISSDDIDVSCKDTGKWGATKRGKITWSATSDNLMVVADYTSLVDAMISGELVTLAFSTVGNADAATTPDAEGHVVPSGGWTASGDMYVGKATISSISLSAGNGELATYSVTFNGVGALTKGATIAGTSGTNS